MHLVLRPQSTSRLSTTWRRRWRRSFIDHPRRIIGPHDTLDRQNHRERRSLAKRALCEDVSTQRVDQFAGNAEAEPRTPELTRPGLIDLAEILPDRVEIL